MDSDNWHAARFLSPPSSACQLSESIKLSFPLALFAEKCKLLITRQLVDVGAGQPKYIRWAEPHMNNLFAPLGLHRTISDIPKEE
ncbi:unnamed protein product [Nippostrongylus brasiliensis]|uniref:Protein kinase domain-containing protein n=1 Tax=Nippostrongylus brasiliensis TaxID=27835 RepID=A0A0N4Y6R4_NIPBR|nr:unnamed protein product [Nippostrongylus brasiliensis]